MSGFGETPNESFHTMQDGWKKEIAEVLHELRIKEKVKKCIRNGMQTINRWPSLVLKKNDSPEMIAKTILVHFVFLLLLLFIDFLSIRRLLVRSNKIQCFHKMPVLRLVNRLKRYVKGIDLFVS